VSVQLTSDLVCLCLLRNFPSLINCCTIDWYLAWPNDALLDVALRAMSGELVDPQVLEGDSMAMLKRPESAEQDLVTRTNIAQVCVSMHTTVGKLTEEYYNETKRRIYVTPKSFLDLLHLYRSLLKKETDEMQDRRDKFMTGLTKMSEITVVIEESKRELDLLRPVLKEKAAKTSELLEKVTGDTKMATEVKTQVALETEEVAHQAQNVRLIQVPEFFASSFTSSCAGLPSVPYQDQI